MKNLILTASAGVVLFVGSMVGMLYVTGQWNHEGLRNFPLLNRIFEAPKDDDATDPDVDGTSSEPESPPIRAVGRSAFNPQATKPSVLEASSDAVAPPAGEQTADGPASNEDPEHVSGVFRYGAPGSVLGELDRKIREHRRRRGQVAEERARLERQIAILQRMNQDLDERIAALDEDRRALAQFDDELRMRFEVYDEKIRLVPVGQAAETLRTIADRIGGLEPDAGASVLRGFWEAVGPDRERERKKALNILDAMEPRRANAILAALPPSVARAILIARIDMTPVASNEALPYVAAPGGGR